jgi:release factor glutamine methyltransferase
MTSAPASLAELRSWATAVLSEAGVPDAGVDADLLIGHVWGMSRGEVEAKALGSGALPDIDGVSVDEAHARFRELVKRRAAREPLQHILGVAWFRNLELEVGPGVFVPRPETEMLAEHAIESLRAVAHPEPIAVDLGTGSGAIALSLATEVPHARVFAVEKSPEAAVWTRRNIARYKGVVELSEGDLANALPELDGTVSVVASNPPYIPAAAVPRDPEVRLFDPEMALYGGEDGLDIVRSLSRTALRLLHSGGLLILEHGELQGADIRGLLAADGWRNPETLIDLTLRDRYTRATRP